MSSDDEGHETNAKETKRSTMSEPMSRTEGSDDRAPVAGSSSAVVVDTDSQYEGGDDEMSYSVSEILNYCFWLLLHKIFLIGPFIYHVKMILKHVMYHM